MDAVDNIALPERRIEGEGTRLSAWQRFLASMHIPLFSISEPGISCTRAVIVAPHPDDELLGCGGLLQYLWTQGKNIALIAVTDGDASHTGSALWTPERLIQERPRETEQALSALGIGKIDSHRLRLPDGQVASCEAQLHEQLMRILRPTDTVFTTWRFDGHPDHEATAAACRSATRARHIRLVETPVWGWHWATPDNTLLPWANARKLVLNDDMLERKRSAISCFRSQLDCDPSTGRGPIISDAIRERLTQPYEIYFL